jgi:hypothetical protein
MKKYPTLMVLACIAFMVIAAINAFKNPPTGNYIVTIHASDYTLEGLPTVSASFIDQVLANAGSPAEGTGQALYSLGVQYGIDPIYALAFFHLSDYGTSGEAAITHSLGNVPCIPDRPCDQKHGGYAVMRNWIDGFDHWYSLILNQYIGQWHLTTVEQILPKYMPKSGGNGVQASISEVEQDVMTWRAEAEGGQS